MTDTLFSLIPWIVSILAIGFGIAQQRRARRLLRSNEQQNKMLDSWRHAATTNGLVSYSPFFSDNDGAWEFRHHHLTPEGLAGAIQSIDWKALTNNQEDVARFRKFLRELPTDKRQVVRRRFMMDHLKDSELAHMVRRNTSPRQVPT